MTEELLWGWSTSGYKSHCWEPIPVIWGITHWALCDRAKVQWDKRSLWTTEKTPGDERTRCKRCLKLVAQEVKP